MSSQDSEEDFDYEDSEEAISYGVPDDADDADDEDEAEADDDEEDDDDEELGESAGAVGEAVEFVNPPTALTSHILAADGETRLESLLRSTDNHDEIVNILLLCNAIYHSGKRHSYKGVSYSMDDLPPDTVYHSYLKKYMDKTDTSSLYVHGAKNVRGDEIIPHDHPMGSLSKYDSSSISKLRSIFSRLGDADNVLFISLKLDGVSMQVRFEKRVLTKAVTRYDHKSGRSVIQLARKFVVHPDPSFEGLVVIGGEVVLRGDSYKHLGFKHPRNGVAGILSRKDLSQAGELDFVAWDLTAYEPTEEDVKRGWPAKKPQLVEEQFAILRNLGYEVTPSITVGVAAIARLDAILERMKSESNIPVDGLVLCPNNWITETSDPPKMKVAYKGQSKGEWTAVISIDPRATRTGFVIPHVVVDPVIIGNTTITNVSGGSYGSLIAKKICVGSSVLVIRSKEVIPFIESVDNTGIDDDCHAMPTHCPSCGSPLVDRNGQPYCGNTDCPAKRSGRIKCFIDAIGIHALGKKRLEDLEVGLNIDSIYGLYEATIEMIMKLDGFGPTISSSIYNQLRTCINPISEDTLLTAMGITGVGKEVSATIVSRIHLADLFGPTAPSIQRLMEIPSIGAKKAQSIVAFYPEGTRLLTFLREQGMTLIEIQPPAAPAATSTPTEVKVFVLTGRGSKTRTEYTALINQKGWRIVGGLSSKVTTVVTDDPDSESKKMVEARALGKEIIDYGELDALLA